MHSTRLYREQHTRIRALCAPLLDAGRASASSAELRSALAKLAGTVKIHLRDEDNELYPRLLCHENREVREIALAFQTAMGGLAQDFLTFYNRWVVGGIIESDATAFFADTDAVLSALLRRMDREDTELYALAEQTAQ
jgi:hemerythrin-like domain-containing protein